MDEAVVLVIDDEQVYLKIISETLIGKNYKILQAQNGKIGLMLAQKFLPDIIITDWEMPEMTGIETVIELKKNPVTQDIPVIMCSGIMTSAQYLETALNAGAADYIRKPVEPLELIARLNAALSLSKSMKKIRCQNDELKSLNSTKDKFFSIIAHDLKNPFQILLSSTDLLSNKWDEIEDDEKKILINDLNKTSNQTYELLENLLEWSRSQLNRIPFQPQERNLHKLIEEGFIQVSHIATAKGIDIGLDVPESLKIFADSEMLKTVIRNLLTNAIKFTPRQGKVSITAQEKADGIEICFSDTGVGMDEKTKNSLFKIEESTSKKGTNGEKGTGIGLILCKEFIEKHEGKIWVESELGKGSNFFISLPFFQPT
jgi:signal transduction histidine kinase